ncbi:MAG: hypothetical protein AB3N28_09355 [Kordiimonas sp.]
MSFAVAVSMMLFAQQDRIFDPKLDKDCVTIEAQAGHEVHCPDRYDYNRAEYVRRLPPIRLPGHSGDGAAIVSQGSRQYFGSCKTALKGFYDHTSKFTYWLQRQKNNFDRDTLTRDAAYNLEQMIRSYHIKVSREAKAKHSYGTLDDKVGYTSCVAHLEVGIAEIYRIGDLVIHELNRGNYDLSDTGLNPHAKRDR